MKLKPRAVDSAEIAGRPYAAVTLQMFGRLAAGIEAAENERFGGRPWIRGHCLMVAADGSTRAQESQYHGAEYGEMTLLLDLLRRVRGQTTNLEIFVAALENVGDIAAESARTKRDTIGRALWDEMQAARKAEDAAKAKQAEAEAFARQQIEQIARLEAKLEAARFESDLRLGRILKLSNMLTAKGVELDIENDPESRYWSVGRKEKAQK